MPFYITLDTDNGLLDLKVRNGDGIKVRVRLEVCVTELWLTCRVKATCNANNGTVSACAESVTAAE